MAWIYYAWDMMGGACIALALVHLVAWLKRPARLADALFAVCAFAIAAISVMESMTMRAASAAQYVELVRWSQIPVSVLIFAVMGFVRVRLGAGRPWLAYTVVGLTAVLVAAAFSLEFGIHYSALPDRELIEFIGGTVTVVRGPTSGWNVLAVVRNLVYLAFLVDASFAAWRRGDAESRRRAALLGGSIVIATVLAAVHAQLLFLGLVSSPYLVTPLCMIFLAVMGFELSRDLALVKDLTDEAAASAKQLEKIEQRMTFAADAAELGFWEWHGAGRSFWMSERCYRLLGIAVDSPCGLRQVLRRVHPEDRRRALRSIASALHDDGRFAVNFRLKSREETPRWILGLGQGSKGEAGGPIVVRGILRDVTRQVQVENEVSARRSELMHLSRVGLLGELSGAIAHELNQPLTAILSNAQAAQRFLERVPCDIAEVRDILADIIDADRRAGDVIGRLRSMLRKDTAGREPIDLNDVVLEIARLMRSDLLSRHVQLRTELATGLPPVAADRVQVQQVLMNLIMNASDAMAEMPVWERVATVGTSLREDGFVEVTVTDQGHGIKPQQLDLIFEPFMTTKAHGMGVGLSLCRTIVRAHGGTIYASNGPSRGTTFRFAIPARMEVAA